MKLWVKCYPLDSSNTSKRRLPKLPYTAVGAAVQGGVMAGTIGGLVLVDVTPLSLGVNVEGDIFSRIIKRNANIPCSNTQVYLYLQL